MTGNWQQISLAEARLLTENSGFIHQETDFFDEDGADEFRKPGTGFRFRYKTRLGDPMTFWINPTIDGKPVDAVEFVKQATA